MSDEDRLRWRCRRGMRELDVLLTRYLEHDYHRASKTRQASFRRLLEAADPDLFAWLMGRSRAPDEELQSLVEQIRASH